MYVCNSMMTFLSILGFVVLILASMNEARKTNSASAKVVGVVLVCMLLLYLMS